MSMAKLLIGIIVLILSCLSLFKMLDSKVVMPIALVLLGFLNLINGYLSHTKKKRGEAIILTLSGVLIVFVSAFTIF
jgi:hypothetical protein